MLIDLIVVIMPQCIHVSNHHTLHLKYIQFLLANYKLSKASGESIA